MKILIVDDEPLVRRSLSRAFASEGYSVLEAVDGKAGLDMWIKEQPEVAFVDVLMPGLTGPQLLQSLPESVRSQTKVILMSAFTGEGGANFVSATGADKFIQKPFDDIFSLVKMVKDLFYI